MRGHPVRDSRPPVGGYRPARRRHHVGDESLANGHVHGSFLGVDGGGAPVSFRRLHVFDLCGGLISREQAWFDTASVLRQIAEHRSL